MFKSLKLQPYSKFIRRRNYLKINSTNGTIGQQILANQRRTIVTDCHKVRKLIGPFQLGEGPHWDDITNVLYFVDINGKTVNKFDPATNQHFSTKLAKAVTAVVPVTGSSDRFLVGHGLEISELTWDGCSEHSCLRVLHTVEPDRHENRFNDGKADGMGNLWIGTMHETKKGEGTLYRLSNESVVTSQQPCVSISNGIAWNSNYTKMYYIDSPTERVDVFDYDATSAEISNRRAFFELKKNDIPGVPDGMTIDSDDNLWVAIWGGRQVIQINGSTGDLIRSVRIPAEQVTSVVFGGVDLRTLYVTTARKNLSPDQLMQQPLAGFLFAVENLGVTGTYSNTVCQSY